VRTRRFQELELSTMMLGTVQLGLPYGISNTTGQPSPADAARILAAAVEGGVNALDTAAVYGSSEEVLGQAIAELGLRDRLVVATKVTQMADEGVGAAEADRIVEASVTRSLRLLRLERLPICLFHLETNWLRYSDSLLQMKERGLVLHAGASVNFPGPARRVIESGYAEAVQMPTSLLDHRFLRAGIPGVAAAHGTALFARSIFLQGLLLLPEDQVLPEHAEVIPVRRALVALGGSAGMGIGELAVRYLLSLSGITCLVVGAETAAQVREDASLFQRGPLEADFVQKIDEAVPDLPDRILYPGNWSKKMPAAKAVSAAPPAVEGGTP